MLQEITNAETSMNPSRLHLEKRCKQAEEKMEVAFAKGRKNLGFRFGQHLIRNHAALDRIAGNNPPVSSPGDATR